jgi:hypothetical protein
MNALACAHTRQIRSCSFAADGIRAVASLENAVVYRRALGGAMSDEGRVLNTGGLRFPIGSSLPSCVFPSSPRSAPSRPPHPTHPPLVHPWEPRETAHRPSRLAAVSSSQCTAAAAPRSANTQSKACCVHRKFRPHLSAQHRTALHCRSVERYWSLLGGDEAVRHKTLDAIGDLRLSPRPIIAEYAAPLPSTRTLSDLSSLSEYAERTLRP